MRQGKRAALLSMIRDVTHRVQTQEEHIQLLRREQAASAQAADALRARDEIFSLVTHDLKNPLTAIKGLAQLLKRQAGRAPELEDATRKKLVQGLEQIDGLATKMTGQINSLLDLARRAPGLPPDLAAGPTDLVALAARKVEELDRVTPQHTIQWKAGVPELVGTWDAAGLERVLDNLLSNAIKYSPAGGTIQVEVARVDEPGLVPPCAWATLVVSDGGIGIPAADLPHIFDRYRRAQNVGAEIAGTGLGLAAVRQIVEQHGGRIQVASEEGVGTAFTVLLPL
jgi:signal transduction histidine kinase